MKKYLLALAVLGLAGCSSTPVHVVPVESWVDGIVTQYPNLHSNDISKQSVKDSVRAYANSYIGRNASLLEGVNFRFEKMIDRGDSAAVFFVSTGCYSDIEVEGARNGHVFTDIDIRVLGKVDRQTAGTLDKNKKYSLKGTVDNWDEEDRFFLASHSFEKIDLGMFILNDNIVIKEVAVE